MVSYTPILKLTQPDFDQVPWDEQINDDLAILDAAFGKFMVIPGMTGIWQNATSYLIGQVLVDSLDSSIWQCAVGHTSAASPTLFVEDRATHPTFWQSQSVPQNYLPIGGGIMTGQITLSGEPTVGGHATTKTYVDGVITRAGGPFLQLSTDGIVNGTITTDGIELADSHAKIYSDPSFTYFVQDSANWYWRYTRGIGTMTYVSGAGVDLFHINANGDIVAKGEVFCNNISIVGSDAVTGIVTANAFVVNGSAGDIQRIYSDATYSYLVPDITDNRYWRYTRGVGTMTYVGSTGLDLFHISDTGDVAAAGTISGNNVTTPNTVSAGVFANATAADFLISRAAGARNIQFTTGSYLTYSETFHDLQWVLGSAVSLGFVAASSTLTNFVGPMSGVGAYVVISDAHTKSLIEPAHQGLDAILGLRPVMFKRHGRTHKELGFIAQDVRDVLPEAVSEVLMSSADNADRMLGISMDPIVAALVNAVKELQARIVELEAK